MKEAKIKQQIKAESELHTPDVYDNVVSVANSEGLFEAERSVDVQINSGSAAVRAKNKKGLIVSLTSVCAVFVALIIVLVYLLAGKSPVSGGTNPLKINLSTDNAYGVGAVSTVKLLGSDVSANSLRSLSAVREVAASSNSSNSDVKEQVERFNEYFTALDNFLGDELVKTTTQNNPDADIPYETKMTISGTELDGVKVEYVMYYTETLKRFENSRNERVSEYTLEGVMLLDGEQYYLTGDRKEEIERDEVESELKIRAYADRNDKSTYVEMKQEQSEEARETEVEYVYSVYSNGRLIEQTAVEFETEVKNGVEEVEYELEFRTGESRGKYKIERDSKSNSSRIKVTYNLDGSKGEFTIRLTADGNYEYRFSDGSSKTFKK